MKNTQKADIPEKFSRNTNQSMITLMQKNKTKKAHHADIIKISLKPTA